MMNILQTLTQEFNLKENHVKNIISLLDEGNTVPFIARYRKEMTGACDDQVLRELSDRLNYLRNLEQRKTEVVNSISEQGKMTAEIQTALDGAMTLTEVEDIYRPYKQKRKTRASVAIAKGLQPLADAILAQDKTFDVFAAAKAYLTDEVATEKDAIDGAQDIIAEIISDDAATRKKLRNFFIRHGEICSTYAKGKEEKDELKTYGMYAAYSEPVNAIKSHRVLALNRGEKEEFLKVSIVVDEEFAKRITAANFVKDGGESTQIVKRAAEDGYTRLIAPSVEREVRAQLFDDASEQAIKMFELNLKPLLMQAPVKDKITMGWDPAFRTGCKICVVDGTGKVLDKTVVFPTPPQNKTDEAKKILKQLIEKYGVQVISCGNGTASKESEIFIAELIKEVKTETGREVAYVIVNEAGASVYSASALGKEEFPDYDVTARSAVSIARRLQDPLAELIKIDPKSIGVGQYQHDMNEKRLDGALAGVLEDCVNSVGVDLNTASVSLLKYVAGLNASVAKNVVAYREENGKFRSRRQLLKVPKLGEKAYTQCAGFLRISDGDNILDNTAVHPESYEKAEKLLSLFSYTKEDVKARKIDDLRQKIKAYGTAKVANETGLDSATLEDIVTELMKPGRDIRDGLPAPMLRKDVMSISDLKAGMELTGTVRNVVDFGAFIDIGVHQDGLVHISEITDRYIKHPSEVLKVGQVVTVRIKEVDLKKNRIGLTMKKKTAAN
ncbi:MAG: RNA-binding transcriptional accessory protein [Clostridiales bacterium]|nr:RNA-binding transcriptional accessory protein [Clostridiales bacterium]